MDKQDNGTGKVYQFPPGKVTKIEPPEDWRVQTKYGTLRHGPGDDARLVRLADILRFMMNSKQVPHDMAVGGIAGALQGRDALVYEINYGGYAKPAIRSLLPEDFESPMGRLFRPESGNEKGRLSGPDLATESTVAINIRSEWLIERGQLARDSSNPAIDAEFRYRQLDEMPFEYGERVLNMGALYAVTFQTAHELWDWGRAVNEQDQATKPPTIEPPTNHAARLKARGSRLHMHSGPGEDGNLVCLYDLVAWLVSDGGLPLVPAIDRVASEIEAIDRDTFFMSQDDYAKPHNPDSPWLKYFDDGKSPAASSVRVLGMSAFDLSKLMNVSGDRPDQSLEFDESKETPFEYFGRTDSCRHALTWRKAYELFDWGRVVYAAKGQAAPAMPLPAGWRDELELGHGRSKARYFLKADANTPLVRIVDVLADFAARQGLPAGEAVGAYLAAVNVPLLSEVYWLRENHFAELVGTAHMYGQLTEAQAQKKTREAADDVDERVSRLHGVTPSVFEWTATPLDALKRHIQDNGPEQSDRSLYAVRHATANRLWGWGAVVAAQAETQATPAMEAPKADSGKKGRYDWKGDPALYPKLVADYGKAKGSVEAKREALAKEWGLSSASIKKQLPIARAAIGDAAKSPFNAAAVGRLTGGSSQ
jgi:hypothetical protein